MKTELSIITVSFNTEEITLNCLNSILKNTKGVDYEIIVVDNGSKDNSVKALKRLANDNPQIKLIEAGENLGFGKANNLGAGNAKGEYLLFLNSDTFVIDNAIKEALNFAKTKKDLGVYSCRLLNPDHTTQPSGGHFPNLFNLFAWQFFIDDLPLVGDLFKSIHPHEQGFFFLDRLTKNKKQKSRFTQREKYPDWVMGAFMMVEKSVFDKAGGFDENIFMYTEEMELTYRIRKLGLKTYYRNTPAIIHLGGASGGSHLALTSEVKYMIYFWKKHRPHWQLPLVKFAFFTGSLLRLLLFGIIKGDEKSRKTYTQAIKFLI